MTKERLKFLLENWGRWQRAAKVGPVASTRCASHEREYASDPSRYVWEGNARVPELEHDCVLAEIVEDCVLTLPRMSQEVLVAAAVQERRPEEIARELRRSLEQTKSILQIAETQLDSALEAVCPA